MPDLNTHVKDQQLKVLQETIRNLQTQLLNNKMKEKEAKKAGRMKKNWHVNPYVISKIVEATKNSMSSSISALGSETDECDNDEIVCLDDDENEGSVEVPSQKVDNATAPQTIDDADAVKSSDDKQIAGGSLKVDEAHIICLVSTFLVVHPFGTSLDSILSYVQCMLGNQVTLRSKELEEILRQHTRIFREEDVNVGATTERSWKFCGFDKAISAAHTKNTVQTSGVNSCEQVQKTNED